MISVALFAAGFLAAGAADCGGNMDAESMTICLRNAEANATARAGSIRWQHAVEVDRIDDTRTCVIELGSVSESPIRIVIDKGGASVFPVGDQYPHTRFDVRVDGKPARNGTPSIIGAAATALLSDMRTGSVAVSRFTEWPTNAYVTREFPLKGIAEHLDACQRDRR